MGSITTGRGSFDRRPRAYYVYRFWDAKGGALYIGMTSSPSGRIATHATKDWWGLVDHFDAEVYPSREQASIREQAEIEKYQPRHNFYHSEAAAGSRSGRGAGRVNWTSADVAR